MKNIILLLLVLTLANGLSSCRSTNIHKPPKGLTYNCLKQRQKAPNKPRYYKAHKKAKKQRKNSAAAWSVLGATIGIIAYNVSVNTGN